MGSESEEIVPFSFVNKCSIKYIFKTTLSEYFANQVFFEKYIWNKMQTSSTYFVLSACLFEKVARIGSDIILFQ